MDELLLSPSVSVPILDMADAFPALTHAIQFEQIPELAGLLAIGADLSPKRLISAYQQGIFPWYSEGEPILWWAPQQRAVIFVDQFHGSRSLVKTLRKENYFVTFNRAFTAVMQACAAPTLGREETWIHLEMITAYSALHQQGQAHSVEVWRGAEDAKALNYANLIGGVYGVQVGQVFCGESMFCRERDMSKVALCYLVQKIKAQGLALLEVQFLTSHLQRLGAVEIGLADYLRYLDADDGYGSG